MINIAELMTDPDFARQIGVRRAGAQTFSNEGVVSRGYLTNSITAIVQPATAAELKTLPEGTSLSDTVVIWTAGDIRIGTDKGQESDVLVIDGQTYRILRLEDWSGNGYRKAIGQRFFA